MRLRNYYAVVATENHVSDFTALFDDEGAAELHRQRLCGDCDYEVVPVEIDVNTVVARSQSEGTRTLKAQYESLPRWQIETPPIGVWAYSKENGLFRIRGKTETNYLVVTKLCRLDRKIEVGTTYTVFVDGPFLYPLPSPFSWDMPEHLKAEVAKGKNCDVVG